MRTTITTITALALGLGALTACSTTNPDPTPTPTPATNTSPVSSTPTSSPSRLPSDTPTPSPTVTLDVSQLAAEDIVNEFFRLSNELSKNPELPLQPLADITTGQTQAIYVKEIADFRAMNAIQTGDVDWIIQAVGPVTQREAETVAVVDVCTDNSAIDVVDQQTRKSVLPTERSTTIRWKIDAVQENGVWRVGDLTTTTVEGCSQ